MGRGVSRVCVKSRAFTGYMYLWGSKLLHVRHGILPHRAFFNPIDIIMNISIIREAVSRAKGSIGAAARAAGKNVEPLFWRLLRKMEDRHLLEACGYRRTAVFSVLSQDIEVSTTVTEPGILMFRRPRLRVTQRFRVTYGVDCAEDAGRCLMFRSAGSIPVRVTSCEPVGDPVIEARSPSSRPAGGQEMVSILGRLQEKARFRADGDVLAICVARMRLRDAFGGE